MVPSYKDNEWLVLKRLPKAEMPGGGVTVIQIRVQQEDEWHDYWVPEDPANSDYGQYQEWLADGNEPRIIV